MPPFPDMARPRGQAGFTLLELVLVLLVLSIMAGLAFPKFRNLGGGDVKVEARTLIGRVQGLYSEATFTRRAHRLVFDVDAERYWGEVVGPDGTFGPISRNLMGPVDLPPGIDLMDVVTERAGKRGEGLAYCYFHPLGRVDVTTIHIQARDGEGLTLQVSPLTGKVDVRDGYVEDFEG